jgi:hypothetical protein
MKEPGSASQPGGSGVLRKKVASIICSGDGLSIAENPKAVPCPGWKILNWLNNTLI